MPIMNVIDATSSYEKWLGKYLPLISGDIAVKHERMAESAFEFLRATFYRWVQNWDDVCSDLRDAEHVLAIGDLHIENFGTWRDLDGRLVWGVNDYDEVFGLAYSHDLVRLGVSARLAIQERQFAVDPDDAVDAILEGYETALEEGGQAFVLEEHHKWLRKIALGELREPAAFWKKTESWTVAKGSCVATAKKILISSLPKNIQQPKFFRRVAGLGSLGRPRICAVLDYHGGKVCREAKRLAPSACLWARNRHHRSQHTLELLRRAKRVPDPVYFVKGKWLVRRLAPHCSKIELSHLPKKRDELELLRAMGYETANIHLGSLDSHGVKRVMAKKWKRNIARAIDNMTEVTLDDWNTWRKFQRNR